MASNNSISIGNAVGSVVVAGDGNTVSSTVSAHQGIDAGASLAEMRDCVAAIRATLDKLSTPECGKIGRAMEDAEEEAAKEEPDKAEVGEALVRALTKAKEAGQAITELEKPVSTIAGWIATGAPLVATALRGLFG